MQKILWKHTLSKSLNLSGTYAVWFVFYVAMMFFNIADGDISWHSVLMLLAYAILVYIGSIAPQMPGSMFLMPVSKEERQKHIKKFFVSKLMVCGIGCGLVSVAGIVTGNLSVVAGVLLTLDGLTIGYVAGMSTGQYKKDGRPGEIFAAFLIVELIFLMIFICVEGGPNESKGVFTAVNVMGVISVISCVGAWYKAFSRVRIMCDKLSDYEVIRIINLPLEERAKLLESGAVK